MKTTIEYFNMTKGKLREVRPDSGYTKEEKLYTIILIEYGINI